MPDASIVDNSIPRRTIYFGDSRNLTQGRLNPRELATKFQTALMRQEGAGLDKKLTKLVDASKNKGDGVIANPQIREFVRRNSGLFELMSVAMNGELTHEERLYKAHSNQLLASDFISLIVAPNDIDKANAIEMLSLATEMARQDIPFGKKAIQVLNGARAHAGLVDLFQSQGFTVLLPEVISEFDETRHEYVVVRDEVEMWDFHNGVDFVVLNPDKSKAIFVDSKARADTDAISVFIGEYANHKHNGIRRDINAYLVNLGYASIPEDQVLLRQVTVPSGPSQQIMNRFGRIKQDFAPYILSEVMKLKK